MADLEAIVSGFFEKTYGHSLSQAESRNVVSFMDRAGIDNLSELVQDVLSRRIPLPPAAADFIKKAVNLAKKEQTKNYASIFAHSLNSILLFESDENSIGLHLDRSIDYYQAKIGPWLSYSELLMAMRHPPDIRRNYMQKIIGRATWLKLRLKEDNKHYQAFQALINNDLGLATYMVADDEFIDEQIRDRLIKSSLGFLSEAFYYAHKDWLKAKITLNMCRVYQLQLEIGRDEHEVLKNGALGDIISSIEKYEVATQEMLEIDDKEMLCGLYMRLARSDKYRDIAEEVSGKIGQFYSLLAYKAAESAKNLHIAERSARESMKAVIYAEAASELSGRTDHALIGKQLFKIAQYMRKSRARKMPAIRSDDLPVHLSLTMALMGRDTQENFRLICDQAMRNFTELADGIGSGGDGYRIFSARCGILKGQLTADPKPLQAGIDTYIHCLQSDSISRLDMGVSHSILGEAYLSLGKLLHTKIEKADAFLNSIRHYDLAIERGKDRAKVASYIATSWLCLGDLGFDETDKSPDNKELRKNTIGCFLSAIKASGASKDNSFERKSKLGEAHFKIAKLSFPGNLEETVIHLEKACSFLDPISDRFSYAAIQRAMIGDFMRQMRKSLTDMPNLDYWLDEMSYDSWINALRNIFGLEEQGKIKFATFRKGNTEIFRLKDKNYPSNHSLILRSMPNKNAAMEDYVTHCAADEALKEKRIFSKPLGLVSSNGRYFVVIKHDNTSDLEYSIMKSGKAASLKKAITNLADYHKLMTEHFSKQKLNVRFPDTDAHAYMIKRYSYLEDMASRMFLGKKKLKLKFVKEIAKNPSSMNLLEADKTKLFDSRVPYSPAAWKLIFNYLKAGFHVPKGMNCVLHGDFYPSNVLQSGLIIDPKKLRFGNPMNDLSHFLQAAVFEHAKPLESREELISIYLDRFRAVGTAREALLATYPVVEMHNSLCLTGAMLNQRRYQDAKYFAERAVRSSKEMPFYPHLIDTFCSSQISELSEAVMEADMDAYEGAEHRLGNKQLVICFDFDGVLFDPTLSKQRIFSSMGYKLAPHQLSAEGAINGGMDVHMYKNLINKFYSSPESIEMTPDPDAKKLLQDLKDAGHKIFIVTSRFDDQVEMAYRCLDHHVFPKIQLFNTNEMPKDVALKTLKADIYVDDSLHKLSAIYPETDRFLRSRPWNEGSEREGISRINSLYSIYSAVNQRIERIKRHS
jgi:uncharacterized HAD superfamily protein